MQYNKKNAIGNIYKFFIQKRSGAPVKGGPHLNVMINILFNLFVISIIYRTRVTSPL
jgi:hypothetical protein